MGYFFEGNQMGGSAGGTGEGIPEAPADGAAYNRKNEAWSDASESGPMTITGDDIVLALKSIAPGQLFIRARKADNADRWMLGNTDGAWPNDVKLINNRGFNSLALKADGSISLSPNNGKAVSVAGDFNVTGELLEGGRRVITEAPEDGQMYVRQNGAWVVLPAVSSKK